MNAVRLRSTLHRACSLQRHSSFHSPLNRRRDDRETDAEELASKLKPESPSFYTARAGYYDQVIQIQAAISHVRKALTTLQLLPLPPFARKSLPPLHPVWKPQDEMATDFHSTMTTTRYRRVTALLNELNDYNRIAHAANCTDLANGIGDIVAMFESGKKETYVAQAKRKKVALDSHGRSYTVGKRKTSSARVWMIPVNKPPQSASDAIERMFGIPDSSTRKPVVSTTTILVNNIPLAEYFPVPADRERITRPFKVAGVLGAYNVFALVRGGGTTGQSGALAHGISKALVAHEPKLDLILRRGMFVPLSFCYSVLTLFKAKLLRRDPRMVERKKTGLAKARKRVGYFLLFSTVLDAKTQPFVVCLGQTMIVPLKHISIHHISIIILRVLPKYTHLRPKVK